MKINTQNDSALINKVVSGQEVVPRWALISAKASDVGQEMFASLL